MGHQIGKPKAPRRGSLAFVPRKKANRAYPRIKSWVNSDETRLLGFAAYKAGMTHVSYVDTSKSTPTKGQMISVPVTIFEAPKLKLKSIKIYSINKRKQKICSFEIHSDKLDKDLKKKISLPKNPKNVEEELKKAEQFLTDAVDIKVVLYTLPKGAAGGKKKPDIFEIGVGGKTPSDQFNFAKSLLNKDISVKDVLKEGEMVDVIAVTKGKGFQGTVKRYGVKLQPRNKTDKTRRGVATIGPDRPRKVSWKVGMPGQMGFHNRYDYNKWILKLGEDGKDINPDRGFLNYGLIENDYIVIKGSVPGAAKRLVRMRLATRAKKAPATPSIQYMSRVK